MLKLKNVSAVLDTEEVINNVSLEINPGEIHAILGPKKSGKSTLAHLIQGSAYIKITSGSINFKNKNITKSPAHKRSRLGIFTTFQHPIEIEGLTNIEFIRSVFQAKTGKVFNSDLEKAYRDLIKAVDLDSRFPDDPVNTTGRPPEDWKKGELVQLAMLQPDLVILDEIDLDLPDETLENVIELIKKYLMTEDKSLIVITHNKELLKKLDPAHVHVLVNGEIRATGTSELYKRIIEDGYPQFS